MDPRTHLAPSPHLAPSAQAGPDPSGVAVVVTLAVLAGLAWWILTPSRGPARRVSRRDHGAYWTRRMRWMRTTAGQRPYER